MLIKPNFNVSAFTNTLPFHTMTVQEYVKALATKYIASGGSVEDGAIFGIERASYLKVYQKSNGTGKRSDNSAKQDALIAALRAELATK